MSTTFHAMVVHGEKLGRTIGFPTLNLSPVSIMEKQKKGVYGALVNIHGKQHLGALFYGPRLVLNEFQNVVEIYVFDFSAEIYDETVSFELLSYIRPPKPFHSLEELKSQLVEDCNIIRESCSDSVKTL